MNKQDTTANSQGLKVKNGVKAGTGHYGNHNEHVSGALTVKGGVKADGISYNHNENTPALHNLLHTSSISC